MFPIEPMTLVLAPFSTCCSSSQATRTLWNLSVEPVSGNTASSSPLTNLWRGLNHRPTRTHLVPVHPLQRGLQVDGQPPHQSLRGTDRTGIHIQGLLTGHCAGDGRVGMKTRVRWQSAWKINVGWNSIRNSCWNCVKSWNSKKNGVVHLGHDIHMCSRSSSSLFAFPVSCNCAKMVEAEWEFYGNVVHEKKWQTLSSEWIATFHSKF